MIQPFENFANAVVDLLNSLGSKWNEWCDALTFTIPGLTVFGKEIWGEQTIKVLGNGFGKLGKVSWNDWTDPTGISTFGASTSAAFMRNRANSIKDGLSPINWNTDSIPSYGEYVNWGSVGDAFDEGIHTFGYDELRPYDVDWSGIWGKIKDAFGTIVYKNPLEAFNGDAYKTLWNEFTANIDRTWDASEYTNPLDAFVWDAYENPFEAFDANDYIQDFDELIAALKQTWNGDDYWNPIDAYKSWYDKGKTLEEGVSGLVDAFGGILDALFGGNNSDIGKGLTTQDAINEKLAQNQWAKDNGYENTGGSSPVNGHKVADSLEDLLGNDYVPSDLLGSIADNTGSTAGSTSNIEETLDLAEEELELLRKLAEQEVINRFTTAEIKVDMTNNNNISSDLDLDGIVTHLSTKLYEELGVVASGVHY